METQPEREPGMVDDPVLSAHRSRHCYGHGTFSSFSAEVDLHQAARFLHLQFPSSTHSRLAHSLGAAKNAELAMQGMFDRGKCYTAQGEEELPREVVAERYKHTKKAKVTALLHDLGHGPFWPRIGQIHQDPVIPVTPNPRPISTTRANISKAIFVRRWSRRRWVWIRRKLQRYSGASSVRNCRELIH